jgi:hypothetical protein
MNNETDAEKLQSMIDQHFVVANRIMEERDIAISLLQSYIEHSLKMRLPPSALDAQSKKFLALFNKQNNGK